MAKYGLDQKGIIEAAKIAAENVHVPVSIFSGILSPLESLTRYLKDSKDMSYHAIGVSLSRDERTIWCTYNNSLKKLSSLGELPVGTEDKSLFMPLEIFSDRTYSILEHICGYLVDENGFEVKEVAKILGKNASAIWTAYKRAQKKKHDN